MQTTNMITAGTAFLRATRYGGLSYETQRRLVGNARLLEQAAGHVWFMEVVDRLVPEFECFAMPCGSGLPMLIRPRNGLPAYEGLWMPVQFRNTVRTMCNIPGKPGVLCQLRNYKLLDRWRDAPTVLASQNQNSIFLWPDAISKTHCVKVESEARIDLQRADAAQCLKTRLLKTYGNHRHHAEPLLHFVQGGAETRVIHAYRYVLLAQAMKLPVFRELKFIPNFSTDGVRFNAVLRGHSILARVARPAPTKSGIQFSLSKYSAGVRRAFDVTDGISFCLLLVAERHDPARLDYIGLVPASVMEQCRLFSSFAHGGARHRYIKWASDNSLDFERVQCGVLKPYFIRCGGIAHTSVQEYAELILMGKVGGIRDEKIFDNALFQTSTQTST